MALLYRTDLLRQAAILEAAMVRQGCCAGLLFGLLGAGISQEPTPVTSEAMAAMMVRTSHPAGAASSETLRVAGSPASRNVAGAHEVAPQCPGELARSMHLGGAVILRALVGKDGAVESLSVVSGPEQLRGSATKAVAQWRYAPYLVDGEPTEVYKTIEVDYRLER